MFGAIRFESVWISNTCRLLLSPLYHDDDSKHGKLLSTASPSRESMKLTKCPQRTRVDAGHFYHCSIVFL